MILFGTGNNMSKAINEKNIYKVIRSHYDRDTANDICSVIHNVPKFDAIPVTFIVDFMKTRDPVYKSNLTSMIKTYNQEVDERDRIPQELFE